jgi:hypothetical protein
MKIPRWMTAFASVLPLDAASRVWDSLILDGLPGLIKATLALLKVSYTPRHQNLGKCCEHHEPSTTFLLSPFVTSNSLPWNERGK